MFLAPTLLLAAGAFVVPDKTMDRWLDETRRLESNGRSGAVGDNGRSRGAYQIQERTWRQFGGRGKWRVNAHNESEARRVARRYLVSAMAQCNKRGWPVTFDNVRHLYRYGLYTTVSPNRA